MTIAALPRSATLLILCGDEECLRADRRLQSRKADLNDYYTEADGIAPRVLRISGASLPFTHALTVIDALARLDRHLRGTELIHLEAHEGCTQVAEFIGLANAELHDPNLGLRVQLESLADAEHVIRGFACNITGLTAVVTHYMLTRGRRGGGIIRIDDRRMAHA